MASTTYSRGYKIKLIGTGLEAGTWGSSTNENLKRIDQCFGGVATAFNITSPTSPSSYTSNTLTWCLGNTTDAWESGSEARNRFVVFTGSVSSDQTVNISGSNSSETNNERVYWVRNGVTSPHTVTISGGSGADVVLQNGSTALIYSDSSGAVGNILGDLQIGGLDFRGEATPEIQLKDGEAAALDVTDGTNSFVKLNTDGDVVQLGFAAATVDIDAATIDTSSQATVLKVIDNNAAGLDIQSSDGDSYIKLDTEDASPAVSIGKDLDLNATNLDLVTQDTDILLATNSATALQFFETSSSGTKVLQIDTDVPKVIVPVELELTGTLDVDGTADFSANATFSNIDSDVIAINNATSDQALYFKKSDAQVSRVFHNDDSLYLESGGTDFTAHGVRIKLERDTGSSGDAPKAWLQTDTASGGTVTESLTPGYDQGLKSETVGSITKVSSSSTFGGTYTELVTTSTAATGLTGHLFTQAHGGSSPPILVVGFLRITQANSYWDVDDEIWGYAASRKTDGQEHGWILVCDDTNVRWQGGANECFIFTTAGEALQLSTLSGDFSFVTRCWW
jgi:hypothetical protein